MDHEVHGKHTFLTKTDATEGPHTAQPGSDGAELLFSLSTQQCHSVDGPGWGMEMPRMEKPTGAAGRAAGTESPRAAVPGRAGGCCGGPGSPTSLPAAASPGEGTTALEGRPKPMQSTQGKSRDFGVSSWKTLLQSQMAL